MVLDKLYKQILVVFNDAILLCASVFLSYSLRFGTLNPSDHIYQIMRFLPLILVVRLSSFAIMGLYRGMWRFVSIRDLISLVKAVTLSSLLSVSLLFLFFRLEHYPRSIFIIDWFIVIVFIGGSRLAYRLYREGWFRFGRRSGRERCVLIVGAGRAGELILRELLGNYLHLYKPIGFVDDDGAKLNMTIHGYKVLGTSEDLPVLVKKYTVEEVLLAIPSASVNAKRKIMLTCKRIDVTCKTFPAFGDLLTGTIKVSSLREFQIEDLLGRAPARLDTDAIKEYVRDKTILITGAGGSIGSELCRQIAQFSPSRMVLFERSEFNLYQIHMDLTGAFPGLDTQPVIGDVTNSARVRQTLEQFRPEVVFHAAAYKHVPLMEVNPDEALRNNAFGTWVMAGASQDLGVRKFVLVSTDKAVKPANIMGASKRISEMICQGFGQTGKTKFVTVRFGNVLNSVGSVIPLFRQQIINGGPVTVTHPDAYRYFMTIPEAAQLILQAGAMGQRGEIFILDMGEPIKIVDLARDMITLAGFEPDREVKIAFTGLRRGEKLSEELLDENEEVKSTLHEKINVISAEERDWHSLLRKMETLLNTLQNGFSEEILSGIREIIPEFQPECGTVSKSVLASRDRNR